MFHCWKKADFSFHIVRKTFSLVDWNNGLLDKPIVHCNNFICTGISYWWMDTLEAKNFSFSFISFFFLHSQTLPISLSLSLHLSISHALTPANYTLLSHIFYFNFIYLLSSVSLSLTLCLTHSLSLNFASVTLSHSLSHSLSFTHSLSTLLLSCLFV